MGRGKQRKRHELTQTVHSEHDTVIKAGDAMQRGSSDMKSGSYKLKQND